MRRGEVYWATLAPRSGSEQRGTRPVIVISHDAFNAIPRWRSVIVVPLSTSSSQARRGPTSVPIRASEAGLDREGYALCHQVTTLDRAKLSDRIGTLSAATLGRLGEGLRIAQDLT